MFVAPLFHVWMLPITFFTKCNPACCITHDHLKINIVASLGSLNNHCPFNNL
jgi:hypothetical protein